MANYQSAYTGAQIDTAISRINNIINIIYPVGSIYISASSVNPGTLFGVGTWTPIEGSFLLGQSSAYPAGTTGGAATVTLDINTMPAHQHVISGISRSNNFTTDTCLTMQADGNLVMYSVKGGTWHAAWAASWSSSPHLNIDAAGGSHYYNFTIGAGDWGTSWAGGGQPHQNMPPYLAVYIWRREA